MISYPELLYFHCIFISDVNSPMEKSSLLDTDMTPKRPNMNRSWGHIARFFIVLDALTYTSVCIEYAASGDHDGC